MTSFVLHGAVYINDVCGIKFKQDNMRRDKIKSDEIRSHPGETGNIIFQPGAVLCKQFKLNMV